MSYQCGQRECPRLPLGGHPQAKEKGGDPKTTWRKTVETELSEMGLTLGETQAIAQDKTRWRRDIVAAICPTGGYKE